MITLDRLVNVLGGFGARLQSTSITRATELHSVVLPETADGRTVTGDVLLAVGADSTKQALRWARNARATVVLLRSDGEQITFSSKAPPAAVMSIDPSVPWSEVAAIVFGLVMEGRETESGRGPTDLFALADSLAESIGGAVVIEDRISQVLAYSRGQQQTDDARVATILARQAPRQLHALFDKRGVFAHLAVSDEPLFVQGDPEHGLSGRMVVAARAGRELLGSVWVACSAPLDASAAAALADSARVVALHMLRSRASADLERQVESELVIRLLESPADAATVVSRLGLPQTPLRVVAVRAHVGGERHAPLLLAFERATAGFGWSRPNRSALTGSTLYTVLAADASAAARDWVAALTAGLPDEISVLSGISGPALPAELATARLEADECLALHEVSDAQRPPPAYDESWDDILLYRLRTAAQSGRSPQRGPVAELREHDRGHGTPYVATLRAYLENQGDPVAAGERLGVHENTVRYRLRRMAEITDLRLDDPRKRLAMMIELAATQPT
ncbi:PucR family transcriptional regulator [Mycolicibacterium sp. XJ1819]